MITGPDGDVQFVDVEDTAAERSTANFLYNHTLAKVKEMGGKRVVAG